MLHRQIRTYQVKCNFCLEWMTLSIDLKFNINVCDSCLQKGHQDKTLQAVSTSGQIYKLYIIQQNLDCQFDHQPKNIENQDEVKSKQNNQVKFMDVKKNQNSTEFGLDKSNQLKQIQQKWSLITQFLRQKQILRKQQVFYLKSLVFQNQQNPQNFYHSVQPDQSFPTVKDDKFTIDFSINQEPCSVNLQQQNYSEEFLKNNFPSINIKIVDKQNFFLRNKSIKENKKKYVKQNLKSAFKSPNKNLLKQKDLNCLHVSQCKISALNSLRQTPEKRVHTQFWDENLSLDSSFEKRSIFSYGHSSNSSFRSFLFKSQKKDLSNEEIKKLEKTKSNILKYIEKNYESNSQGRLMLSLVFQAYLKTTIVGKSLELISYKLSFTDLKCYLEAFDWSGIEVLKLVNTSLRDDQLKILIDFIVSRQHELKVLVLTGNKLTEASIEYLHGKELNGVKQIYLGKNRIMKGKVRDQIKQLQSRFSLYL